MTDFNQMAESGGDYMQIGEVVERTVMEHESSSQSSYFGGVQANANYFQLGFLQDFSSPILDRRSPRREAPHLKSNDDNSSQISTEHEATNDKKSHQMLDNLCPQSGKRKLSTLNYQFQMQLTPDTNSRKQLQKMCRMQLSEIQPQYLNERQIHVEKWLGQQQPIDKIFAANWLNEEEIILGTKCNNIIIVNQLTGKMKNIPTISRQQNEIYNPRILNYGIHTISMNPSKTLMLTGGQEPQDAAIYELNYNQKIKNNNNNNNQNQNQQIFKTDLVPKKLLIQHKDWLFGSAWISDDFVVTASRDKSLCMWQIPTHAYNDNTYNNAYIQQNNINNNNSNNNNACIQIDRMPIFQVPSILHGTDDVGHLDKIRDVRFSNECGRLVTLGLEGRVMLWDLKMQLVRKIKLQCRNELACMHVNQNLIAVGSKTCVTFIDIRSRRQILDVSTPDSQHSVRSICMRDHVLSTGNGRGRLHFFDIRANKWLINQNQNNNQLFLQSSQGSLRNGELFRSVICTPAIYSHSWSPCETKLVLAGGPLQCGMQGAYLGVWE